MLMSMRSPPRELTNSVSTRAGTVTDPSSSTIAPIQVVMAISRLVAESRSIPWSAESSTFWVTGRVARVATARPTTPRPRLRFSCKHEISSTFTLTLTLSLEGEGTTGVAPEC